MDNSDELHRRRAAIRPWLNGTAPQEILRRVQRGHAWFSKWRKRFQRKGWREMRSHSRRPRRNPKAYSARFVRLIVQTRRRLARQQVGLSGPRAIQRELRQLGLGQPTPSLATIKRVLQAHGLSTPIQRTDATLLSRTADDARRHLARHRLDLTLSGTWSEGLCLSQPELAHARAAG
jgi:transposase